MSTLPTNAWFAIQTRPRHEKAVAQQLASKGYTPFLPCYRARRRWSDRMRVVELPLFDSYVFCHIGLQQASRIITTRGVIRIVGIAGVPVPIDDAEIEALQRIVASNVAVEPWPLLRVGQRVRIAHGSLSGIEGLLEDVRGRRRLVVSVSLLQRSVAVELDRTAVVPLETSLVQE